MEHHPLRGHVAVHRRLPAREGRVVGETPAARLARVGAALPRAVFVRLRSRGHGRTTCRGHHRRLRALHRLAHGPLRRGRRHTHRRHHRRHDEEQRRHPAHRQLSCELGGHHRRGHAAHTPAAAREPLAQAPRPRRHLLHLPGRQRRRLPHAAGRPAAVPRLPARRAVLLDA